MRDVEDVVDFAQSGLGDSGLSDMQGATVSLLKGRSDAMLYGEDFAQGGP